MSARTNTTIVHLTFHSFLHGAISLDGGLSREISPQTAGPGAPTSLVRYSFDKRLGTAAGQFGATLKGTAIGCTFRPAGSAVIPAKNGDPWLSLLNSGDWWQMSIERNGQVLGVSVGVIDTININLAAGLGETQILVSVNGRGIGFALEDVPVYFNPHDPAASNDLGINMMQIIESQGGDPGDMVRNMVQGMFGQKNAASLLGSHIKVPPSLEKIVTPGGASFVPFLASHWIDMIDLYGRVQGGLPGKVLIPQPVLEAEQTSNSVWEFVRTWCNPTMNEIFVDIDPTGGSGRAFLILREHPFINLNDTVDSPWTALPTPIVDADTLISASLSKGGHRVNHVTLLGDLTGVLGQDAYALHPPIANMESVETYGLKRLVERTNYYEDSGAEVAESQLKSWRSRIVAWNALNHKYLSGSLMIAEARADIRVGQRLALVNGPLGGHAAFPTATQVFPTGMPADALTFYVEGVRYTGSFGPVPSHTTEVMVSRGFVDSDRLPELLSEFPRFVAQNPLGVGPVGSPNSRRSIGQNSPIYPPTVPIYSTED